MPAMPNPQQHFFSAMDNSTNGTADGALSSPADYVNFYGPWILLVVVCMYVIVVIYQVATKEKVELIDVGGNMPNIERGDPLKFDRDRALRDQTKRFVYLHEGDEESGGRGTPVPYCFGIVDFGRTVPRGEDTPLFDGVGVGLYFRALQMMILMCFILGLINFGSSLIFSRLTYGTDSMFFFCCLLNIGSQEGFPANGTKYGLSDYTYEPTGALIASVTVIALFSTWMTAHIESYNESIDGAINSAAGEPSP
jgi:hypothetical protein